VAIGRTSKITELVEAYPDVVGLLISAGLPCVVCGEPFWGTLEELAGQKGWDDPAIDRLVEQLREKLE
jgi:hypothetical protein